MPQTECPKCHALQARRVKQEGLAQKLILQKLGYFPWECRFCKASFLLRSRGHRKSDARTKSSNSSFEVPTQQGVSGD